MVVYVMIKNAKNINMYLILYGQQTKYDIFYLFDFRKVKLLEKAHTIRLKLKFQVVGWVAEDQQAMLSLHKTTIEGYINYQ